MTRIKSPSSLKWLIDKRSRLMGDIKRLEDSHQESLSNLSIQIEGLVNELRKTKDQLDYQLNIIPAHIDILKSDLAAIDRALALHDIQIDISLIGPTNSHQSVRQTKHGEITRGIYECLKKANSQPLLTTQIAIYVARYCKLSILENDVGIFRESVRYRLKDMARDGKIQRIPTPRASEGKWALKMD